MTVATPLAPSPERLIRPEGPLAPPGDQICSEIITETVTDEGTFFALRDAWDTLAERSASTIFQTHEWLWLWWKHFGLRETSQLHILVCRAGGEIAGIIPLFLEERSCAWLRPYRVLRLMGCGTEHPSRFSPVAGAGPSDFLDFIAPPEFASGVAETAARYLGEHGDLYDEVELEHLNDRSVAAREFIPRCNKPWVLGEIRQTAICPRIDTPEAMAKFLGTMRSSVRRRLSQAIGNNRTGIVDVAPASHHATFDEMVRLHQERWNRLGYAGLFSDARFRKFQEEVLDAFAPKGWLWFKAVRAEGAAIACRLGYTFGGHYYDYVSGFDDTPRWSKNRAGLGLLLAMLEDAIASRAAGVELLRGDEAYKFELTQDYTYNRTFRLVSPLTRNRARFIMYRMIRWISVLGRQGSRELALLGIQYRRLGAPRCLATYASFRLGNLMKKFRPDRHVS